MRDVLERMGAVELELDNSRLENVNLRKKLKAHEQKLSMESITERYEAEVERYARENERLKAEVAKLAARAESHIVSVGVDGASAADDGDLAAFAAPTTPHGEGDAVLPTGGRQHGLRRQLKRAETERDALAAEAAELRKQLRRHEAMRRAADEMREKLGKMQRENDQLATELQAWQLRDARAEGELSRRDAAHIEDRTRAEVAEEECEELRLRVTSLPSSAMRWPPVSITRP